MTFPEAPARTRLPELAADADARSIAERRFVMFGSARSSACPVSLLFLPSLSSASKLICGSASPRDSIVRAGSICRHRLADPASEVCHLAAKITKIGMSVLKPSSFCIELLRRVAEEAEADFSGVGFICYSDLSSLPHLALDVPQDSIRALPIIGVSATGAFLAEASRASSPLHDGFHLIAVQSFALTHACHFIAPVIPPDQSDLQLAAGARHMSAQLASRAQGVEAAALITKDGTGVVYESGIKIFEERLL